MLTLNEPAIGRQVCKTFRSAYTDELEFAYDDASGHHADIYRLHLQIQVPSV